jgi:threonine dehydrogenase-like Zn-dependent dehydrogenase
MLGRMLALVLGDALHVRDDHPMPQPPRGESLLRVRTGGVCNTDVELIRGYHGFKGVLGHEFVAELTEDAGPFKRGQRVVSEISCVVPESTSRTWFQRSQDPQRTTIGIVKRDGAFAQYLSAPLANLHAVPDGVSDDEAVFTEPLAAACQILEQVHVQPGMRVGVLGDGKLGLLIAQVLATSAARVALIGKHDNKLEIVRRRGIDTLKLADAPAAFRSFDVMVEVTGSPTGFDTARKLLRPRGTLVLKSTYAPYAGASGPHPLEGVVNTWQNAMTMLVVEEMTVVGSRCGPFAAALRLLADKRVDVASLIHARFPLAQGVEAIAHAQRPGVLKVMLDVG